MLQSTSLRRTTGRRLSTESPLFLPECPHFCFLTSEHDFQRKRLKNGSVPILLRECPHFCFAGHARLASPWARPLPTPHNIYYRT